MKTFCQHVSGAVRSGVVCIMAFLYAYSAFAGTDEHKTGTHSPPEGRNAPSVPTLDAVFARSGFGYSIRYPVVWTMERGQGYAVVFGGKQGTEDAFVTVSLDNRLSPRPGEPERGAAALAARYAQEIRARGTGSQVEPPVPFLYKKDGVLLEGRQMVATFDGKTERMQQWAIFVPRRSGTVVHVWIFSASVADFNAALPVARAMLDSWRIAGTD
ncbi:MAG: hypothetical protein FD149_1646 [Rhodospirillaceae bacterium]|nr:MAG: hypothetical protein FD149_1646 [Rhodospirillaceae bacterium]